jgi:hypothetical protein
MPVLSSLAFSEYLEDFAIQAMAFAGVLLIDIYSINKYTTLFPIPKAITPQPAGGS